MHWRFIDRVDSFEPWKAVAGTKAVSFEEASLLKPFGRKGDFPGALVLECCVELVRWLVAASSGFSLTSAVSRIDGFHLSRIGGPGGILTMTAEVERRGEDELLADCRVEFSDSASAGGRIAFVLVPLAESFDPGIVSAMWRELHGAA